jgi:hypothetical protein
VENLCIPRLRVHAGEIEHMTINYRIQVMEQLGNIRALLSWPSESNDGIDSLISATSSLLGVPQNAYRKFDCRYLQ